MPQELPEVLRNGGFEEIDRVARMAESFCRSLAEAAYRGDQVTVEVHVRQLRLCIVHLIRTYKDLNGSGVAETGGQAPDRSDQQTGDGMG